MSDDEPVVRHVRLCQCGKPADHNSLCRPERTPGLEPDDVERVAPEWEEYRARKREEHFAKMQRDQYAERRYLRERASTADLFREAQQRQVTLTTVAASNTERGRGGGDPSGPPAQQLFDDDPRVQEHWTVIRSRLYGVLNLLDEAEGHGTVANTMQLLGEEKDRLILHRDNEGLRAQAVVDKLGTHIAGSVRTVQRVRQREGFDHLGHIKTDK